MPGYWRRPIARVYNYNLDLGESYYAPMSDYLDQGRRARGETPGALTYSERVARKWCGGESDRQMRAKTEAFERDAIREAIRATSEIRRREITPPVTDADIASLNTATEQADAVLNTHRRMIRDISEDTQRRVNNINARYEDSISKRMADIRLSPWRGQELEDEYKTSRESRARITGLERELDEITRKAMTYRRAQSLVRSLPQAGLCFKLQHSL